MTIIPSYLQKEIAEGKAVLLLGSGASREARDAAGNTPPMAQELSRRISEQFLGGKYLDHSLDEVAAYAINESDLYTVQNCIREIFESFQPTTAHSLMTTFQWEGLATTNYDTLIEKAYATKGSVQVPQPFIQDGDRIHDKMRNPNSVKLLKLHGCITHINNPSSPLILTVEQYNQFAKSRRRLFDQLYDWASERSIIFIGHSLKDPDIRLLISQLIESCGENRPRYYAVTPDVDEIQSRFWESRKVTCIPLTFHAFMESLDSFISSVYRRVRIDYSSIHHPVEQRFIRSGRTMSDRLKQFLDVEVDYVKACTNLEAADPKLFYRGSDVGWSAIEQALDVRRGLSDEIISDTVLDDPTDSRGVIIILIQAHAGAGKTTFIKRVAWDASHDYNRLCLFVKRHGSLDPVAIQELQELCGEQLYLFIDNAASHVKELRQLANSQAPEFRKVTVIATERTNQWNLVDADTRALIHEQYELEYLSDREIDHLLALLKTHGALGTLSALDHQSQHDALKKRAGRQLLVAMHEATLGRPFEDIVEDEYKHIPSIEGQKLYLTICVLNRLNVWVRAGIIARIHGIRFEDFEQRLFKPLEGVVFTKHDPIVRDYVYAARHPHIADIIFVNVLANQEARFDAYIRCLQALNLDYKDDAQAFKYMIRARSLLDWFVNPDLIRAIFQEAQVKSLKDAYVFQQMGIFEMNHQGGDIVRAEDMLRTAERLAPKSISIKHSLAEVELRLADRAHTDLQRDNHLKRAEGIAQSLLNLRSAESHPYHTLCKVGLKRLESALAEAGDSFSASAVEEIVKNLQKHLSDGLQLFPDDSYLADAESQFADLLKDSNRALLALERAFKANKRNGWFAIRLARIYELRNNEGVAADVLRDALEANPNNKELHYAYAKFLFARTSYESAELRYHLQRSYAPGDTNYDAQLLLGRQLYIDGDLDSAAKVFSALRGVRVSPAIRNRINYPMAGRYYGAVVKQEVTYLFVQRDATGDWIFVHKEAVSEELWKQLSRYSRVSFTIGFAFRGANGFELNIA